MVPDVPVVPDVPEVPLVPLVPLVPEVPSFIFVKSIRHIVSVGTEETTYCSAKKKGIAVVFGHIPGVGVILDESTMILEVSYIKIMLDSNVPGVHACNKLSTFCPDVVNLLI